jgi:hypothetical protein
LEDITGGSIIDGMSLIKKMKRNDKTFSQLAGFVMSHAAHKGAKNSCNDVVFDNS